MVVHSNPTRDDRVARALHSLRTFRNLDGRSGAYGLYFAIRDHDRLVFLRWCTVPSMTRTWLRTKIGVSTLTKSATSLAFWVWATVVAATSNDPNKYRRRISMHPAGPTFESFGKKPQFYPRHTYLVGERNRAATPWVGSSKPWLDKIVVRPNPVPPESRANRKQLFVNRWIEQRFPNWKSHSRTLPFQSVTSVLIGLLGGFWACSGAFCSKTCSKGLGRVAPTMLQMLQRIRRQQILYTFRRLDE